MFVSPDSKPVVAAAALLAVAELFSDVTGGITKHEAGRGMTLGANTMASELMFMRLWGLRRTQRRKVSRYWSVEV